MNNTPYRLRKTSPLPLGTRTLDNGVSFSIFSRHATRVHILVYRTPEDTEPEHELVMDPKNHRYGDIWCAFVEGLRPGQGYALRMEGPWDPSRGLRFDPSKILVDPYARAVAGPYTMESGPYADSSLPNAPRNVVVDCGCSPVWTTRPRVPWEETIIYELHVRGFTKHPSSGIRHPGTFRGLAEKLNYIKELGATSIELLPIASYPRDENINRNPLTGERLVNYWGYSPLAPMAPMPLYAAAPDPMAQLRELRDMVDAVHEAGMEVILDVVFNHTCEGGDSGPIMSFKGIDNPVYYILDSETASYANFSGCGNTFNCNHPVVRDYILDVLRYWAVEFDVDGFRFDLASILGRDSDGNLVKDPPVIERISSDPILRHLKLIAEAWDAAGAYQVGSFPGHEWSEWNGRYRDDVRRFWRGDPGMSSTMVTGLTGSEDLYTGRGPLKSINMVTCHDGFTLRDLVSYSHKHNEMNGEDNRDGSDENFSWNCGIEGDTTQPKIRELRLRYMKSLMATLLISRGVPMILAGDEFGNTQYGNNNAYCHDNPVTWLDWRLAGSTHEATVSGYPDPSEDDISEGLAMLSFVKGLIAIRKRFPRLHRGDFYRGIPMGPGQLPDITWISTDGRSMDWTSSENTLGAILGPETDEDGLLAVLMTAVHDHRRFILPSPPRGHGWHLLLDTSLNTPPVTSAVTPVQNSEYMLRGPALALLATFPEKDVLS